MGKYWGKNYLTLFKPVFVIGYWSFRAVASFFPQKVKSWMKSQSCTNIWEILTKSSVPQRKNGSSRLSNALKLSSKQKKLHKAMYLWRMFSKCSWVWIFVVMVLKPYKTSGHYGPDCRCSYSQFDWNNSSKYLYITEVLWKWLKSTWWKRFLKKVN